MKWSVMYSIGGSYFSEEIEADDYEITKDKDVICFYNNHYTGNHNTNTSRTEKRTVAFYKTTDFRVIKLAKQILGKNND